MGSVVSIRRPPVIRHQWQRVKKPEQPESLAPLAVYVGSFFTIAIAMAIAVVLCLSNTWAEALPLIGLVFVIALAKIILADVLFYIMVRSDRDAEAVQAEKAAKAGAVLKRGMARTPSLSFKRAVNHSGVIRRGGGKVTILAHPPRKEPPRPSR